MALDPNIILAAGRTQPLDPGTLLQQGNQIALGRLARIRGQQTQNALDRVRANPDDPDAITALAAVDPAAGNAYRSAQADKRALAARPALAALASSLAGGGAPAANDTGTAPHALDHSNPTMQALGQTVASKQLSPADAFAQAITLAGPEAVNEVVGSYKNLDEVQQTKIQRANASAGQAALHLLQNVPDDATHGARRAALSQLAPQLQQMGVDPSRFTDLSDQGLHGIVGQATTVAAGIEQANKDREFALKERGQQLDERKENFAESKPENVAFGSTLVRPNGQVVYGGDGGTAPTAIPDIAAKIIAVEGTGKNPSSSASGPGQMINSTFINTFRQAFPNQANLTNAQILAKRGSGLETQMTQTLVAQNAAALQAAGIPPTAGNVYLSHFLGPAGSVAAIKADPSTPMRQIVSPAAIKANPMLANMTAGQVQQWAAGKMSNGSGVASTGGAGGMSAAAIDLAARQGIANGGQVPAGYSRNRAAQAAITNRMAELAQGTDANTLIQNGQTVKSQGNAYKVFNTNKPGTGGFQVRTFNVANAHLDQLGQTAGALASGNVPLLNRISQAYATATGKPAPTNFNTIKQYVSVEVLKAIEGGVGGVGDRQAAEAVLNAAQSPQQLTGAIKQIQGLMVGQLDGVRQSYETSTGRNDFQRYLSPRSAQMLAQHTSGGSRPQGTLTASLPTFTPDQARSAPKGTRFRTTDGRVMVRQ